MHRTSSACTANLLRRVHRRKTCACNRHTVACLRLACASGLAPDAALAIWLLLPAVFGSWLIQALVPRETKTGDLRLPTGGRPKRAPRRGNAERARFCCVRAKVPPDLRIAPPWRAQKWRVMDSGSGRSAALAARVSRWCALKACASSAQAVARSAIHATAMKALNCASVTPVSGLLVSIAPAFLF
jgi:hypothetical protein